MQQPHTSFKAVEGGEEGGKGMRRGSYDVCLFICLIASAVGNFAERS